MSAVIDFVSDNWLPLAIGAGAAGLGAWALSGDDDGGQRSQPVIPASLQAQPATSQAQVAPPPQAPPTSMEPASSGVTGRVEEARKRLIAAKGRDDTIATSQAGLLTDPDTYRPTILGVMG